MFPVRCYTCNKCIAQYHSDYSASRKKGDTCDATLNKMKITRMCCRRMFLSHVDLVTEQVQYPNKDSIIDENGTTMLRFVKREREFSCD